MKKLGLFTLLTACVFCANAFAGVAFECMSNKSKFEIVRAWYAGERWDVVTLKPSSVYGIQNKVNYGQDLVLNRQKNPILKGPLQEYPLQYSAKQSDDLGEATTTMGIPMGTLGADIGKAFRATLVVDNDATVLDCEIVGFLAE